MAEEPIRPTIGEFVLFYYRKDPLIQLKGCVVSVLENTIVVEIRSKKLLQELQIEARQVVRHEKYIKL
ncbi:DUF2187 family protein [Bacillus thuringiensis]